MNNIKFADVKRAWKTHIDFPTMIAFGKNPSQMLCSSYEEFERLVTQHIYEDAYASVHDVKNRENHMYNSFHFDLDNDDLEVALSDARKIKEFFEKRNVIVRSYFSANKGFHIYVDFPLTEIKDYSERVEYVLSLIKKEYDILSFDEAVCKDANRIMRIPYTINTKSNRLCIPIDLDTFTFDTIKTVRIEKHLNRKFIADVMSVELKPKEVKSHASANYSTVVNYIMQNADKIKDGRRNLVWKILIPACVQLKLDEKDTYAILEEFYLKSYGEYNYTHKNFVRQQFYSAVRKNIKPMRLERFVTEINSLF